MTTAAEVQAALEALQLRERAIHSASFFKTGPGSLRRYGRRLCHCEDPATRPEDLIHKACGWMLREAGRHSRPMLLHFLKEHYPQMRRTSLRYAIEHLPVQQRKQILAGIFENR